MISTTFPLAREDISLLCRGWASVFIVSLPGIHKSLGDMCMGIHISRGYTYLCDTSTVGTYTESCGFPYTVMCESFTEYLTSIYGFGGRYRFEGTFVELCWECLQDIYTLGILPLSSQFEYNMSGTWKENKRSTPSLNFDDTSKFWGEKCIGSSRFNQGVTNR